MSPRYMKQLTGITALVLVALLLGACPSSTSKTPSSDESTQTGSSSPFTGRLTVEPAEITFNPSDLAAKVVAVVPDEDYTAETWSVATLSDWFTCTPTTGVGQQNITITPVTSELPETDANALVVIGGDGFNGMTSLIVKWTAAGAAEGQAPVEGQGPSVDPGEYAGEMRTFAGINFCWCPPGTFLMGSPSSETGRSENEGPQHQVTLSRGFWMSRTEITQAQWTAVMGSNPSYFTGDTSRPVERVSWNNICASGTGYLARLNASYPGYGFRLPTEAEWEYACRAGSTMRFHWGDDSALSLIGSYAWYSANGAGTTHSVASKVSNSWGLYDMSGNVWEWCSDWYAAYTSSAVTDPTGPTSGSSKVLRGGGYSYDYSRCRSAYRDINGVDAVYNYNGFRIVIPGS